MKKMIIGNQAVAYGALSAGIDIATGYPGTPSSEALTELFNFSQKNDPSPYVEWSVNEKVAFEVATGAAWTGKRAITTMKMSGCNVASDSILSVAYSGTRGGLVIYIADDPGAEAGMPEQDTRLFALQAGLPLLEASTPQSAYKLTRFSFELSEKTELPVILRLVTSVSHAQEMVEGDYSYNRLDREASFERDIFKYTKAGSAICVGQHETLLLRLKQAERIVADRRINRLNCRNCSDSTGFSVVSSGSLIPYVNEELMNFEDVPHLALESIYPLDENIVIKMLKKSERVLILEELEPVVEIMIRSLANKLGWCGTILGKMDGLLPRTGKYEREVILKGLEALVRGNRKRKKHENEPIVETPSIGFSEITGNKQNRNDLPPVSIKHPITFCAGCPHRGTFMALVRAIKRNRMDRNKIIVTGDIGCTILGMNPPFNSCWTEVSMGSSIGLAQGFVRGGIREPVVATIGDSTFFHAGMPPLINAVQHRTGFLLIIMDNGWTCMTGFQPNPGTEERFQGANTRQVDISRLVQAMGIDDLQVINPFDQEHSEEVLSQALLARGVRVVIARKECAITVARRGEVESVCVVDPELCNFCKRCLRETGCQALFVSDYEDREIVKIDTDQCNGCTLCITSCPTDAISIGKIK